MTETSTVEHANGLRFVTDWRALDSSDAEAIRAFWIREQANVEGDNATRRLPEVVLHAIDDSGAIAAVATAQAVLVPRLGQPMYYYRHFVGKAWRTGIMSRLLLRHTQRLLGADACARGFPCIGILLELENEGFARTLRRAFWPGTNFVYVGHGASGLEQRIWYFRGARLKTREEALASLQKGEIVLLGQHARATATEIATV